MTCPPDPDVANSDVGRPEAAGLRVLRRYAARRATAGSRTLCSETARCQAAVEEAARGAGGSERVTHSGDALCLDRLAGADAGCAYTNHGSRRRSPQVGVGEIAPASAEGARKTRITPAPPP